MVLEVLYQDSSVHTGVTVFTQQGLEFTKIQQVTLKAVNYYLENAYDFLGFIGLGLLSQYHT